MLTVPKGMAAPFALQWDITSSLLGGQSIANSNAMAQASSLQGYESVDTGSTVFVEQWCAPSAAALAAPVTVTRTITSAAAVSSASSSLGGVTLVVVNRDRCRLAPLAPLTAFPFPAAPGASLQDSAQRLAATCTPDSPRQLDPAPGASWSWNVLQVLGTNLGMSLGGLIAADAAAEAPQQGAAAACADPSFRPMYVMSWLPEGGDIVSWCVLWLGGSCPVSLHVCLSGLAEAKRAEVQPCLPYPCGC